MKRILIILFVVAIASAASAQTTSGTKTTTKSAPAGGTATKTSTPATSTAKPGTTSSATIAPPWIKLPPGIPRVVHGPLQTPITLHYEEIKVGAGAEGESGKIWHIKYTGWRAADGIKFDAWDEHTQPVIGKDGKPELGPDGKPKMKDPEPLAFPQGVGRVIPGFDYGLTGMKIGGKRRIFIPWQLAYGTRSMPDRPGHPGIPAKSDLIFDVELVDVTDMPAPPQMRPGMPPGMHPHPGANGAPSHPGATGQPGAPGAAPAASTAPAAPATKPAVPTPPQPATPPPAATAPAQPSTPPPSK